VAEHIEQRLLQSKRLEEVLSAVLHRQKERAAERAGGALDRAGPSITPQVLKTFTSQARSRMRTEAAGYRRDHLRAPEPDRPADGLPVPFALPDRADRCKAEKTVLRPAVTHTPRAISSDCRRAADNRMTHGRIRTKTLRSYGRVEQRGQDPRDGRATVPMKARAIALMRGDGQPASTGARVALRHL
jgi:hypothetical protein